jgi:3-dehydroquinate synthase
LKKIDVKLNKNSYPIFIGSGIFKNIEAQIKKENLYKNILVVVDGNVEKKHNELIKRSLSKKDFKVNYYKLTPGEKSKTFVELNKLYSYLLKNGYGRDTLIVAIGGGVTGDLIGYAAATFMRGVQLVHVPTTLLATVDSAIGGKTGINFENKKNMIGAFYQPKFVLIDINFLKTLPLGEITSGLGEVIKYTYMADAKFFNYVSANLQKIYSLDNKVLNEIIFKSAGIKAEVVAQDEREKNLRKILNLGHTFAHGFESELKFSVKHGEAVIAGVISAIILSNKIGLITDAAKKELLSLPLKVKLPNKFKALNTAKAYEIMKSDKKNRGNIIKFVLVSGIGKILLDVEPEKKYVYESIEEMKTLIKR